MGKSRRNRNKNKRRKHKNSEPYNRNIERSRYVCNDKNSLYNTIIKNSLKVLGQENEEGENEGGGKFKSWQNVDVADFKSFVVLPFSKFGTKNMPFRFEGKWWRCSKMNQNFAVNLRVRIQSGYVKFRDKKEVKRIQADDLIACFKSPLTEEQSSCIVGDAYAGTH